MTSEVKAINQTRRFEGVEVSKLLPIEEHRNPIIHREHFNNKYLRKLGESLKERQLEPIKVTIRDGKYIIVYGESRVRAAQLVGLDSLDAVVEPDMNDRELAIEGFEENRHRRDIDTLERIAQFAKLREQFPNETIVSFSEKLHVYREELETWNRLAKFLVVYPEYRERIGQVKKYILRQLRPFDDKDIKSYLDGERTLAQLQDLAYLESTDLHEAIKMILAGKIAPKSDKVLQIPPGCIKSTVEALDKVNDEVKRLFFDSKLDYVALLEYAEGEQLPVPEPIKPAPIKEKKEEARLDMVKEIREKVNPEIASQSLVERQAYEYCQALDNFSKYLSLERFTASVAITESKEETIKAVREIKRKCDLILGDQASA